MRLDLGLGIAECGMTTGRMMPRTDDHSPRDDVPTIRLIVR